MKYDIPDEFKIFVQNVKRRCKANNIELVLSPSRAVVLTDSFSTDCAGYFDDSDRVLAVACGKPFDQWIEILIHEYSHMEQYLHDERWAYWGDCCAKMWEWLDNELELDDETLLYVVNGMIDLERDCELRALANIIKWDLPINKSRYQRKANLYLYSYRLMPITKKFPTGIYENEDLIKLCPKTISKKVAEVPENVKKLILKLYT